MLPVLFNSIPLSSFCPTIIGLGPDSLSQKSLQVELNNNFRHLPPCELIRHKCQTLISMREVPIVWPLEERFHHSNVGTDANTENVAYPVVKRMAVSVIAPSGSTTSHRMISSSTVLRTDDK